MELGYGLISSSSYLTYNLDSSQFIRFTKLDTSGSEFQFNVNVHEEFNPQDTFKLEGYFKLSE